MEYIPFFNNYYKIIANFDVSYFYLLFSASCTDTDVNRIQYENNTIVLQQVLCIGAILYTY